jgi:uncharacterized protein YcfJ
MKKIAVSAVSVCLLCAGLGCASSQNRAFEGATIGGLIGAGAGAIIGHQSGETGEGAALGAGAGALVGALAGSQVQKQPQGNAAVQPANPNQISVLQVIELTRQGVHEDVIVDRIRLTNSRFSLSASDVDYLKSQGVSQKVIMAMQGY